jgi:hypothetical protein
MKNKIIVVVLLLFVVFDLGYSFLQHYHYPLDGDIAESIVPSEQIGKVYDDPFGLSVILHDSIHANPNRYFAHITLKGYMGTAPFVLQKFTDPITSVFLASGIFKLLMQIFILIILTFYVNEKQSVFSKAALLSFALITPLLQTGGYKDYMGIVDNSISYIFFYALPLAVLLVFYLPFYRSGNHESPAIKGVWKKVLWILMTVYLTLSSPLIPGVVLVVTLLMFAYRVVTPSNDPNKWKLKGLSFGHFLLILLNLLSLYSLYVGSYNASNAINVIPLAERYSKIPSGLTYLMKGKYGFPILIPLIVLNAVLIGLKFRKEKEGKSILSMMLWSIFFIILYILLLPLGGYREYRPVILRFDTIMPATLVLFILYVKSSAFLVTKIQPKWNMAYAGILIIFSILLTSADKAEFDLDECQKTALTEMRNSPDSVVHVSNHCWVLSWAIFTDPKESEMYAELIHFWKITDRKKLFYQDPN